MEVKLVVTKGKAKGRAIPLPSTVVTIGRGRRCHLRPHCRLVSNLHCAIACWAGKVVVRDLKSSNGTYVNGERVEGEVRIQDGDSLQIGTLEFSIRIQRTEPSLPVQVVFPSEIKWLTDMQDGSACQSPFETQHEGAAAGLLRSGSNVTAAGSAGLSAGDSLREYLRKRQ